MNQGEEVREGWATCPYPCTVTFVTQACFIHRSHRRTLRVPRLTETVDTVYVSHVSSTAPGFLKTASRAESLRHQSLHPPVVPDSLGSSRLHPGKTILTPHSSITHLVPYQPAPDVRGLTCPEVRVQLRQSEGGRGVWKTGGHST